MGLEIGNLTGVYLDGKKVGYSNHTETSRSSMSGNLTTISAERFMKDIVDTTGDYGYAIPSQTGDYPRYEWPNYEDDYTMKFTYSFDIKTALDFVEEKIDKVIFNPPATIILFKDGSRTVVKAQDGEKFDKEKGLAMAIVKTIHMNKGSFNNLFNKYCK